MSIVPSDTASQTTANSVEMYKQLRNSANATINRAIERLGGDVIQVVTNQFTGQEVQLGSKDTLGALKSYLDFLKEKNLPEMDGNGRTGNNAGTKSNGEIAVPRVNITK